MSVTLHRVALLGEPAVAPNLNEGAGDMWWIIFAGTILGWGLALFAEVATESQKSLFRKGSDGTYSVGQRAG